MNQKEQALEALNAQRWRISTNLTLIMLVIYFGFILLTAFAKGFISTQIIPGLSWGILLGVLVIISAWVLTLRYVRWANNTFDEEVKRLQ